jgi:hypothetical protein
MAPIADIDRIARGIGRAEVRGQSLFWRRLFNTTNSDRAAFSRVT